MIEKYSVRLTKSASGPAAIPELRPITDDDFVVINNTTQSLTPTELRDRILFERNELNFVGDDRRSTQPVEESLHELDNELDIMAGFTRSSRPLTTEEKQIERGMEISSRFDGSKPRRRQVPEELREIDREMNLIVGKGSINKDFTVGDTYPADNPNPVLPQLKGWGRDIEPEVYGAVSTRPDLTLFSKEEKAWDAEVTAHVDAQASKKNKCHCPSCRREVFHLAQIRALGTLEGPNPGNITRFYRMYEGIPQEILPKRRRRRKGKG